VICNLRVTNYENYNAGAFPPAMRAHELGGALVAHPAGGHPPHHWCSLGQQFEGLLPETPAPLKTKKKRKKERKKEKEPSGESAMADLPNTHPSIFTDLLPSIFLEGRVCSACKRELRSTPGCFVMIEIQRHLDCTSTSFALIFFCGWLTVSEH
jgi:hypothetical protein